MNPLRQNLLIALTSVILLLGGLEGFARLVLGVQPAAEELQMSSLLGWEWTPGYDLGHLYYGSQYQLTISSQGLRNEEIIIPKPPNIYRIMALGDSITAGPGVALEQTFAKRLEQLLRVEQPNPTIEVINAGTTDYNTEQELIWLRERGLAYEPDLVIVGVYLNDSRPFDRHNGLGVALANFFGRYSAIYVYYRNTLRERLVAQAAASPDFRFRFVEEWQGREWMTDPEALEQAIQSADEDWGKAWQDEELAIIENELSQIIQLADEQGFKLMLVFFPVAIQVYAQEDIPLSLNRPQQKLTDFAERQGVPHLDLLPVFHTYRSDDLFFDHVHLKPETHQLVAEAIHHALREYQLVP